MASRNEPGKSPGVALTGFWGFAHYIIERFGPFWGAVLFLAAFFLAAAQPDQKRRAIDTVFFLQGIGDWWPLVVGFSLFLVVIYRMRSDHEKAEEQCREEIKRIGEEKSLLQEELAGRKLRHSKGI